MKRRKYDVCEERGEKRGRKEKEKIDVRKGRGGGRKEKEEKRKGENMMCVRGGGGT